MAIPFSAFLKLSSKDILRQTPEGFLKFISEELSVGRLIIFKPPLLGELFFDYLFYDPNDFVKIKQKYFKPFDFDAQSRLLVAVHFRGTDFPDWNETAALKFPYYREAISFCLEFFRADQPMFRLFTDDLRYPTFLQTIQFLQSGGIDFTLGDTIAPPVFDLYSMSQCDVVISTPSTFSIWGGCLGKRKKIIHDKKWMEYSVARNDTFWVKLAESGSPYYSLWNVF